MVWVHCPTWVVPTLTGLLPLKDPKPVPAGRTIAILLPALPARAPVEEVLTLSVYVTAVALGRLLLVAADALVTLLAAVIV